MRHVHILEHLLHDPLKDRRRDLASLVQADGGVEDHHHRNLRIIDRSKPGKGRDIFCLRVKACRWVHLLGRASFARRTVALENGFASSTVEHHSLQHLPHLGRGQR